MKKKLKADEPSLRDKLSQSYLEAFQADFAANGVSLIEQLRNKSPDKYAEIAARLIAATEPRPNPDGIANANSLPELGMRLLRSVGMAEDAISESAIEEALAANSRFITALEEIAARSASREGELN